MKNYFTIPAIQHSQTKIVDILSEEVGVKTKVSFNKMTDIVCNFYHTSMREVISRKKNKNIVNARHVIVFIGYEILTSQHPTYDKTRILRLLADKIHRDRTSIIYTTAKISGFLKYDIYFKKEFEKIKNLL